MKRWITVLVSLVAIATGAAAQQNLVPNGDFSDKTDPLKGWRYVYPHMQQVYGDNQKYIRIGKHEGKRCVEFALTPAIANNQGAMIETAFIKVEAGATYQFEVDCCPNNLELKIFVEAWAPLPAEIKVQPRLRIWPAENGQPMLIVCDRKHIPAEGKKWLTVRDTYTVPKIVNVAGTDEPPEYLSIKVFACHSYAAQSKAYATNFRLIRTR